MLGKVSVPERPTDMDNSRTRSAAPAVGAGGGLFEHFISRLSFLSYFSLLLGDDPI